MFYSEIVIIIYSFISSSSYFFLLRPPPSFPQWKHEERDHGIETSEETQRLMDESQEEQETCSQGRNQIKCVEQNFSMKQAGAPQRTSSWRHRGQQQEHCCVFNVSAGHEAQTTQMGLTFHCKKRPTGQARAKLKPRGYGWVHERQTAIRCRKSPDTQ